MKKERIIRELESKRWRDPSGGIMSYALSMSYATSWRRLWIYIPMEGGEDLLWSKSGKNCSTRNVDESVKMKLGFLFPFFFFFQENCFKEDWQ